MSSPHLLVGGAGPLQHGADRLSPANVHVCMHVEGEGLRGRRTRARCTCSRHAFGV